jgi:hypothetical protein
VNDPPDAGATGAVDEDAGALHGTLERVAGVRKADVVRVDERVSASERLVHAFRPFEVVRDASDALAEPVLPRMGGQRPDRAARQKAIGDGTSDES